MFENNRECYHCDGTHPELLSSYTELASVRGGGEEDPALAEYCDTCEAAGLASRQVMDPAGQFRMTRIPLNPGPAATPWTASLPWSDAAWTVAAWTTSVPCSTQLPST